MKARNLILTCLACALSPSFAGAATEAKTSAAPALSAEQIVERNVAARGGLSAWRNIQSISMAGKLDAGRERVDGGRVGLLAHPHARAEMKALLRKTAVSPETAPTAKVIQLPFRMDLQRPGKSRMEVDFRGDTAVQVYDGSNGWKLRPFLGRRQVENFTADETRIASQQQELDGPLIDHAAKGIRVEAEGVEQVEGRNAYKLKLTLRHGEVRHLWVDSQSFLDVKFEGPQRRFDGRMRPVWTYFRDYKRVDGVMLPYLLETEVAGVRNTEKIVIEKVALNPPLEQGRFSRPQ